MGLAMLGDKLSAEQAEAWGLIWKCVDDDKLMAEAEKLATRFSTAPTKGLARTKQALYASSGNSLEQQLELERALQQELGAACSVEVIDVLDDPDAALRDGIYATPTVVRVRPSPIRRIFGRINIDSLHNDLQLDGSDSRVAG